MPAAAKIFRILAEHQLADEDEAGTAGIAACCERPHEIFQGCDSCPALSWSVVARQVEPTKHVMLGVGEGVLQCCPPGQDACAAGWQLALKVSIQCHILLHAICA